MTEQQRCNYYESDTCRSCSWMKVPYKDQIRQKESRVLDTFGKEMLSADRLLPAVTSPVLLGSRNKAKFIVGGYIEYPSLGMATSEQETKDLSACPLHDKGIQNLTTVLKKLITEFRLGPYSISRRKGELKAIIVRVGAGTGNLTVRFVVRSHELRKNIEAASKELIRQVPSVKVGTMNIQPEPAAILEGPEEIVLSKDHFMEERLGDFRISISPQSFSQVSSLVADKLYQTASEIVGGIKPKFMLDLFCGTGCFSLFSAKHSGKVLGVELSASSISDANRSAEWNNLQNLIFEKGDVVQRMNQGFEEKPDLILVNPPRRGLGEELCNMIATQSSQNIIYSSCNVKSLVDDVKRLTNYHIKSAQVFDMFPLTEHFEALIVLSRN